MSLVDVGGPRGVDWLPLRRSWGKKGAQPPLQGELRRGTVRHRSIMRNSGDGRLAALFGLLSSPFRELWNSWRRSRHWWRRTLRASLKPVRISHGPHQDFTHSFCGTDHQSVESVISSGEFWTLTENSHVFCFHTLPHVVHFWHGITCCSHDVTLKFPLLQF